MLTNLDQYNCRTIANRWHALAVSTQLAPYELNRSKSSQIPHSLLLLRVSVCAANIAGVISLHLQLAIFDGLWSMVTAVN